MTDVNEDPSVTGAASIDHAENGNAEVGHQCWTPAYRMPSYTVTDADDADDVDDAADVELVVVGC